MPPRARPLALTALTALSALLAAPHPARADETSAEDRLRLLYSNRFHFTDAGLPLITVEIMNGQREVRIRAAGGVLARPDGAGGSTTVVEGEREWVVSAEATTPALIREWTVVATLAPDDSTGVAAAVETWRGRGFEPRTFEIGTVFGVAGELIDSREVRVVVAPVEAGKGAASADEIARRFGLATSVHPELARRPSGTLVARAGTTTLRNPSVIWFEPRDRKDTLTVPGVVVGGGGSQLTTTREDRRYWGSVYVTLDRDGKLLVANAVAEDKLLAGLVPAEIFPDAPEAALEAQAIAARTELLGKIGRRNLTDPFVLCSTQACQVYAGAGKEHPRPTAAIGRTRGVVLLRDGGGLIDVRYSASCGGHSEDNEAIWGGEADPSLRGHRDDGKGARSRIDDDALSAFLAEEPSRSWCGRAKSGASRFRWTVRTRRSELEARIRTELRDLGRLQAITVRERGVSGRAVALTLRGSKGEAEVKGDLRIRRLFGGLKSSLFKVEFTDDEVVFTGAGFGHGVGMCQMGAIGMAEAGREHRVILRHYYPGTHLHKLY